VLSCAPVRRATETARLVRSRSVFPPKAGSRRGASEHRYIDEQGIDVDSKDKPNHMLLVFLLSRPEGDLVGMLL